MLKSIKSLKNPLVKQILALQAKARDRKESGLFVIEGVKEITRAIEGGYTIEKILFAEHLASYFDAEKLVIWANPKPEIIELSREVHLRLCVRENSEPFLALAKMKESNISYFRPPDKKDLLVLVAESPEKPGNIGALFRTADAAGVDLVFIANPRTDLYNPNVIRSSLGCVFTVPFYEGSTTEIINALQRAGISIYSASLEGATIYADIQYPDKTAIVVGTEDKGLTGEWLTGSTRNIKIPMAGKADSLNVSVSTGILLYEVARQKGFTV